MTCFYRVYEYHLKLDGVFMKGQPQGVADSRVIKILVYKKALSANSSFEIKNVDLELKF